MRRLSVILLVPVLALGAGCGDDDDASAGGDFCDRARLLDAQMSSLENEFEGDDIPSSEVFDEAADALGDLADGAPSEIKGDLETLADGVREIAEIFGDIDLSDPEALSDPENAEQLQAMGERMEELDATVGDASDRVEAYLADECGIEIDDDGTSEGEDGTEGS